MRIDAPCGTLDGIAQGGVASFRGIPYAAPPMGPLRWRLPEPLSPWAGARDATRFGPACPQAPSRLDVLSGGSIGIQSEDCLYLNVWAQGCDGGKRPVMVWLHGGAFVFGAGHQGVYDGRRLAERGVVVVTINYRLGAFGFLALDGMATGAEGLADQVAALEWVKANIASFGGDPGNVTLFGESAGAMSVAALLACPSAQGLFHKAIAQSGAAHIGHTPERAARVTNALLDRLGTRDPVALRSISADTLRNLQTALLVDTRLGKLRIGSLPFQPAAGNAVLPTRPIDTLRPGGVPLLTGTTMEEWKLFTAADPRLRFMSAANFRERVTRLAADTAPALFEIYDEGAPYARFNALMTDKAFVVPATRMLEAHGGWLYRFDWRSKFLGGLLGSCHALELGFVFGTYNDSRARIFFGKGPQADALSDAMMTAWVNFARSGDPGWPRYDTATRQTMIFGDGAPHLACAPNETRRAAWDMLDHRLGP